MNNKYYFPLNYKYSAKFLGIIEYKILLPISIGVAFFIFIFYMLKVDFFVGAGIIVVLTLPTILFLSTGINGQPAIPYLKAILKFSKSKKLYIYKK